MSFWTKTQAGLSDPRRRVGPDRAECGVLEAILSSPGQRTGILAAIGTGAGVSMVVARFFIELAGEKFVWALVPAGLALVCTTLGTLLAVRARSTRGAVLWVLASNVLPPTLLCAPTIIGVFFATPSGLAAFILVLPVALLARHSAQSERSGHSERDALHGAGFAGLGALALAGWELTGGAPSSDAVRWLIPVPALLAATTALAMAGWVLARGVRRDWVIRALGAGQLRGLRVGATRGGAMLVERAAEVGSGPHRAAVTSEVIGAIEPAASRTLAAALITTAAAGAFLAALVG